MCRICVRDCPAEAIEILSVSEEDFLAKGKVGVGGSRQTPTKSSGLLSEEGVPAEEEKKIKMVIHNDRCVHCAQCVESCPTGALEMNFEFELAAFDRHKLKAEYVYVKAAVKPKTEETV